MNNIRRALARGKALLEYFIRSQPPRPLQGLTLYHYPTCPYCLRVRLAMRRLGVSLASRNVDANADDRAALEAHGGRVQVPCLHIVGDQGERWLYDSAHIIAYLTECSRKMSHG